MTVELFAEVGQFLAVIGVDDFQPQAATHREVGHVFEDHADPVGLRQLDKAATSPLTRENQFGKTQAVHQPFSAALFSAHKLGTGSARLGLGVASHIKAGGVLGDFRADFAFKPGPAVHKNGVH